MIFLIDLFRFEGLFDRNENFNNTNQFLLSAIVFVKLLSYHIDSCFNIDLYRFVYKLLFLLHNLCAVLYPCTSEFFLMI